MATVSSVLPESTTMRSSAHDTESSAAAMSPASFFVMMVTESFGTGGSVIEARESGGQRPVAGPVYGLVAALES